MKIEIARQDDRMAPSGEAILRSLQNETLPIVDLVVRESFQNSLDASLPNIEFIKVDININKINTSEIARYFEGVENNLLKKLPKRTAVISLKDTNTSGLTGDVNTEDAQKLEESNIYKLIYGIFMRQERKDAGGSWGLGKTSFFRIGSGIVVYYSRIQTETGEYEERLAACLIEDNKKEGAIMPNNPRGIAWWGDKDSDSNPYEKTYPITDTQIIHEMLNKLEIQPFTDRETGTAIVIPFINEDNLVKKKEEKNYDNDIQPWETSLENEFEVAIKRWYTPRIANQNYLEKFNQPYLMPLINGKLVTVSQKETIFSIIKKLYNAALLGHTSEDKVSVKPVYLKQMGMINKNVPTGNIAYCKYSVEELGLKSGYNVSPLAYLGLDVIENKSNAKVLGYARKPGMIVEYVLDDNEWMNGVIPEEDSYVFAIFVPNSDGLLHESYNTHYKTLENYLRSVENADHATWEDKILGKKKITVIKRIKVEISKILSDVYGESIESINSRRTLSLSRQIGQQFLPKLNFGKSGSPNSSSNRNGVGNGNRKTKTTLNVNEVQLLSQDTILVNSNINIAADKVAEIEVKVATTDKTIGKTDWYTTFQGTYEFPFEILDVSISNHSQFVTFLNENEPYTKSNISLINRELEPKELTLQIKLRVLDQLMQPLLVVNTKEARIEEGEQ